MIDLRNEVGLLSQIYIPFSLWLSDQFHSVRHSLSLWIFMLVTGSQRNSEQVEDVSIPLQLSFSSLSCCIITIIIVIMISLLINWGSHLFCSFTVIGVGERATLIFWWHVQLNWASAFGHLVGDVWVLLCGDIPYCHCGRCHLLSSPSQQNASGRRCHVNADSVWQL